MNMIPAHFSLSHRACALATAILLALAPTQIVHAANGTMYSCIVSLVTTGDATPDYFKKQLQIHEELVHISVEVNRRGT